MLLSPSASSQELLEVLTVTWGSISGCHKDNMLGSILGSLYVGKLAFTGIPCDLSLGASLFWETSSN